MILTFGNQTEMHFWFEGKDGNTPHWSAFTFLACELTLQEKPAFKGNTRDRSCFLAGWLLLTHTWSQIKIFWGLWNFARNTGFPSIQVPFKSGFPVLFYLMLSLSRRVEVHHTHGLAVSLVFILNVSVLYLHITHNFSYADSALIGQTSNEFYKITT
jgi:CDP-diglyceride synthetase